MKRRLRSRLDLIHPDVTKKVESKQEKQKLTHDTKQPIRKFTVNDHVLVRNLPFSNPKWLLGVIVKVTGPLSYVVRLSDEKIVRKHVDHIIQRNSSSITPVDADDLAVSDSGVPPTPDEDTSANPVSPPPNEVSTDSSVTVSAIR